MSGLLPDIFLPSDMRALQARLLAAAKGTDQGVQQCNALDTPTRAAWGDFYIQVVDFASQDPGTIFFGSKVDQAKSLQSELYAWQQKLAHTCTLITTPEFNPDKPKPPDPTLSTIADIFKWGAIAAVAVGGAYVVGKTIALIPPARRIAQ